MLFIQNLYDEFFSRTVLALSLSFILTKVPRNPFLLSNILNGKKIHSISAKLGIWSAKSLNQMFVLEELLGVWGQEANVPFLRYPSCNSPSHTGRVCLVKPAHGSDNQGRWIKVYLILISNADTSWTRVCRGMKTARGVRGEIVVVTELTSRSLNFFCYIMLQHSGLNTSKVE